MKTKKKTGVGVQIPKTVDRIEVDFLGFGGTFTCLSTGSVPQEEATPPPPLPPLTDADVRALLAEILDDNDGRDWERRLDLTYRDEDRLRAWIAKGRA